MKMFAITIALAGSAAVAPLSAQARPVILNPQQSTSCAYTRTNNSVGDVIFGRANTSNCQDVYTREDGAWYQIGRGNTYERRVRDRYGNLVIQHARRNSNGTFTVLNTRSAANDRQWRKEQQQALKQERKAERQQQKVDDRVMRERLRTGVITQRQYDAWKRSHR